MQKYTCHKKQFQKLEQAKRERHIRREEAFQSIDGTY